MFRDRTSSTKKARSHSFRKLTIMRRPRRDELMYHSMVQNARGMVWHRPRRWQRPQSRTARALPNDRCPAATSSGHPLPLQSMRLIMGSDGFPGAVWIPAHTDRFAKRDSRVIEEIVLHITEGGTDK